MLIRQGCKDSGEICGVDKYGNDLPTISKARWIEASKMAASFAQEFADNGLHKQVCNRLIEPFQYIKAVITFTGFGANFFRPTGSRRMQTQLFVKWPRLCRKLWIQQFLPTCSLVIGTSRITRMVLSSREWIVTLEQAKRISASCCAQVSFRKLDDSSEKADKVFERLVESKPVHASPTEHQATPLKKGVGFS